ncbi:DUF302 domain-containing protein [Fictibacillus fluitans]|uniref:DUF302 domain-containing protein n=1 Tax=Fictibacillus fluitans TaxID=3058422 RepID=A0ABT8HRE2_9BACL|nr:DUF302 domain-containing protein [Fictibacillus sp. NE201]MDN4523335.1 DUF302 domain-containing protein [Fictibacillus sp. NE201]
MFDYTIEVEGTVDQNAEKLERILSEEGFGVLWSLNLKDKLEEKGLELSKNFKVLEVCNPKEAKEVLEQNEMAGYFLPCKMVVYESESKTKIGMPKPSALINMLNDQVLQDKAKQIEDRLIAVMEKCQ